MFINHQSLEAIQRYHHGLEGVGRLSSVFSTNDMPYLGYRAHENIFCWAFGARNLARADVSIDAVKNGIGLGLKTFLHGNGRTFQKIAEFNATSGQLRNLTAEEISLHVAMSRNKRLEVTRRMYECNELVYHIATRRPGKILLYEESMAYIDLENIRVVNDTGASVDFFDGQHSYRFNRSKSTLFKQFITEEPIATLPVEFSRDFDWIIEELIVFDPPIPHHIDTSQTIYLPLYSREGIVPERSGLNQWNAKGRLRNKDELYISIPSWIHDVYPDFFPDRDTKFCLVLPSGQELSAKVCQDNSKALMSNPNKALGHWLLRDVLKIEEGTLVTFEMLADLGIDSVQVEKIADNMFQIDFAKLGSYSDFKDAQ